MIDEIIMLSSKSFVMNLQRFVIKTPTIGVNNLVITWLFDEGTMLEERRFIE